MTWAAASPGFPAAFSLLARGGGAAASLGQRSPGQRGRAALLLPGGARAGRPEAAFGERGQPCPPGEGEAWQGRQVLPVPPAEDARGRSAAEPGAERAGPGKAPAPAARAPRLPRPPEAQPEGQVL